MKRTFPTIFLITLVITSILPAEPAPQSRLDLSMPRAVLNWVEFMNTGRSEREIREYFMRHVASTPGCRVIIRHWARFRKDWNNETFLDFVLQALGHLPPPGPEKSADGTLTAFGRRKALWTGAFRHPERLERLMQRLTDRPQMTRAVARAAAALPPDTPLENHFYLVVFGASTAFSVGAENGIDLLQLPQRTDGSLSLEEVGDILAHELHHTGFFYWLNHNLPDLKIAPVILTGILAAEGMATHYIDRVPDHLKEYRSRRNTIYAGVAADWDRHSAALPALYRRAAGDMRRLLLKKAKPAEVQKWWMAGAKGPAYILGADMIARIEMELGREAVFRVVKDFRTLIHTYNRAALHARSRGGNPFIFPAGLAGDLAAYSGS